MAKACTGVSCLTTERQECVGTGRVLLDNCSTFNQMVEQDLLSNTRQVDTTLHDHCNAGVTTTNWVGTFDGLPGCDVEAWLNRDGIANILSVPALKKQGFRITYDSDDGYYTVSDRKGGSVRFVEGEDGLPALERESTGVLQTESSTTGVSFAQTV